MKRMKGFYGEILLRHCRQFLTPFPHTVRFVWIYLLLFLMVFCTETWCNLDLSRSKSLGCRILLPLLLSFYHSGAKYWIFYFRSLSSAQHNLYLLPLWFPHLGPQ